MSQKTIDPEIVSETQKNKSVQKESDGKKVLAWIIMAMAVAYGLSPIDIVPDIPIVGWIDDFMIGTASLTNLIQQQFFQTNNTLNKLFNMVKWMLVGFAIIILLIAVLIITLIVKN